jgi:hypothetical protein
MTERHTIFTKASQTREADASTVSREGGGSVHPTLGGGCLVSPDVARSGRAFEGVVR